MRVGLTLAWVVLVSPAFAQSGYDANQPLRPEVVLLARIRYVMAQNLGRLPNYTCTMTIERSTRPPRSKRFQTLDTVRIEVALLDGKELYAWPGSSRFEERELSEIVQGGAIGTGDFGLHAKSIFVSNAAQFTYQGRETLAGVPVHRFSFVVPQNLSGYRMRVTPNQGIVGYRGTVWNHADTLDLLKLEIDVHQIPPQLPVTAAGNLIEYQQVPIGGSTFLLPKSSELVMTDLNGAESRNRTTFSNCHQYSGESVLTFEDPKDLPAQPAAPPVEWTLPPGLDVNLKVLKLESNGHLAVGDPFEAIVTKAARRKGEEWLPKGARLQGRVVHFSRLGGPATYFLVGLKPERFEFDNKFGAFHGQLLLPSITYFLGPGVSRTRLDSLMYPHGLKQDVGYLLISNEKFEFPSSFSMVWRTLELSGDSTK